MDVQQFAEIGKSLGYEGQELREFVAREVDHVRLERREERSRIVQEKEKEVEKAKLDGELRKDEMQHELELVKVQLESDKLKQDANASIISANASFSVPRGTSFHPKLPCFVESSDSMDSYLNRFEKFGIAQKWDKEDYATFLSTLLTGKALDVYSRLPVEHTNDYEYLKAALLSQYQLTGDDFRKKFFSVRQSQSETAPQFMANLDQYLSRWIDLTKTDHTFAALRELILRQQFLIACPKELSVFLRQQDTGSIDGMMECANRFSSSMCYTREREYPRDQSRNRPFVPTTRPSSRPPLKQGDRYNSSVRCYRCQEFGHYSRSCPQTRRGTTNRQSNVSSRNAMTGSVGVIVSSKKKKEMSDQAKNDECQGGTSNPTPSEKSQKSHNCTISDKDLELKCGCTIPISANLCAEDYDNLSVYNGTVHGKTVNVLRDSGCTGVVIRKELVDPNEFTGEMQSLLTIDRTLLRVPTAKVFVDTPLFTGTVLALCIVDPICDLIIGNIDGIHEPEVVKVTEIMNGNIDEINVKENKRDSLNSSEPSNVDVLDTESTEVIAESVGVGVTADDGDITPGCAVMTRAQVVSSKKPTVPLLVPESVIENVTSAQFAEKQRCDETLDRVKIRAYDDDVNPWDTSKILSHWFRFEDGLLYRYFRRSESERILRQLVVPRTLRRRVITLAHDTAMAGHLGIRKTTDRVLQNFFWPGIFSDIRRFCQSCDICQRTVSKGSVMKAPLQTVPIIKTPFEKVAIDLIGPISPPSARGHRWILTLVDYATRYPEAVALTSTDTETVAEALLGIFSRVGIPSIMLSDNGPQFVSGLMDEVMRLLSIKSIHSSRYHPMANGLCEKYNGTLKRMLRRMAAERPSDWDRYIEPLLFSYREIPSDSTGFSPFELLYGRSVRGPMSILRELWTNGHLISEQTSAYEYVLNLRNRIEDTCQIAADNLKSAHRTQKKHFDKKSKLRNFNVDDKVLVLLPTNHNKLLMQWKGPYNITETIGNTDYKICIGRTDKIYHVNMLKGYVEREIVAESEDPVYAGFASAIIDVEMEDNLELEPYMESAHETHADAHIDASLTDQQQREVVKLITEFSDIFSDLPGYTHLLTHDLVLETEQPFRLKPYPVPFAKQSLIEEEVDSMLKSNVIEHSHSPYASPLLLVKKADGKLRPVVDFRRLNKNTRFDAEPIPNPEDDIFAKLSGNRYFSKLDFCKGYWQIPLGEDSKEKTAFATSRGLFQFRVMPFGLVNAAATYSRLMRMLFNDLNNVENYIDDVLVFSDSWNEHVNTLREVFMRIRDAGLTIKPSKCHFGQSSISFLGHDVVNECLHTQEDKVDKIKLAKIPETKTQVRSFLGLTNYYRKFIPHFAHLAHPFTQMTKKGQPERVVWTEEANVAFEKLKYALCSSPILRLPDFSLPFILRTDASQTGIGAVLLQRHADIDFPIAFASKMLNHAQTAYATVELECLAVVWGIERFTKYLYGREFTLQTDHQPLAYLNSAKQKNCRLMRWVLRLQLFRFHIESIPVASNVGADYLSRL